VVFFVELMRISHVIRAQEHLNNTFRHVLLQEALGFNRPVYAHISVVTNPDGSKMSKRDKDKVLRAAVREGDVLIELDSASIRQKLVHLHTIGRCEGPGFESAGPHFNPHGRQHGFAAGVSTPSGAVRVVW
jgi:hypothetical protein